MEMCGVWSLQNRCMGHKCYKLFRRSALASGVMILVTMLWLQDKDMRPPRAGMVIWEFRAIDRTLNSYFQQYGEYPPRNQPGRIYTFASDALITPTAFLEDSRSSSSHSVHKGPVVDPFRKERNFLREKVGKANFQDGHNSDGFYSWFSGYPLRNCRNSSGKNAVLLSNGPDEDADIKGCILDEITTYSWNVVSLALEHYTYDAANGTVSNGDVWRVVMPE